MLPLRLDHVVVPVHDPAAARRFYQGTLGLPLVGALTGDDWGGHPWLMMIFGLEDGGRHLVTTTLAGLDPRSAGPYPRDARHHALAVDSEAIWEAWRARLRGARADFWEETHGDQRSLYVADPSGNLLEITTPPTAAFDPRARASAEAAIDAWIAAHP
jgi:catechol 2,3-dioxygenase-like lactoylglutathione lyase family enzyme